MLELLEEAMDLEGRAPVRFLKDWNQPAGSEDFTIISTWKVAVCLLAPRFRHLHQMRASSTRNTIKAPPIVPPIIAPRFLPEFSPDSFEGDEEGDEPGVDVGVIGSLDVVELFRAGEVLNELEVRLDPIKRCPQTHGLVADILG